MSVLHNFFNSSAYTLLDCTVAYTAPTLVGVKIETFWERSITQRYACPVLIASAECR